MPKSAKVSRISATDIASEYIPNFSGSKILASRIVKNSDPALPITEAAMSQKEPFMNEGFNEVLFSFIKVKV